MEPASHDPTSVRPAAGPDPEPEDPAERLGQLWDRGDRPDVDALLAAAGPLSPGELAEVLRTDQRRRWRAGERVRAETYLQRYPALRGDRERAVDLIYHEFLLRERQGERPDPRDYLGRFPQYADVLGPQIELHGALAAGASDDTRPDTAPPEGTDPTPAAAAPPALPETFGRYRILRLLGRGGMAAVYLAHDTRLDRRVALKVPRFGPHAGPLVVERFAREARVAATLAHPHLCPVYDVGQADGTHYLTMPFLAGESLAARLARAGPLPEAEAARLARAIAEAVEVAHRAGVVHRDLKPANVMFDEHDEPVVMDFGLAVRAAVDPRLTEAGALVGTPAYGAPEQIGAGPEAVRPAADVYSLGVILYEMLTGRPPFAGDSLAEVLRRVLTEEPEPPSRRRPGLDPRLEAVCLRALAREPGARFASMADFAAALAACRRGAAAPARPGRRLAGRLRAALLGVLAAIACLLLRPAPPADALQAGSVWAGTFHFRPPFNNQGPVEVRVAGRAGDRFWGTYATEGGQYEWRFRGTVRNGRVRWEFTEVLREAHPVDVVGKARVEGTYGGTGMDVVFHHDVDGSTADMHLRPVP
jgi:serine/threonine-protein kinase